MIEYIVDLEGYSILFKPQQSQTEIVQFQREPFTKEAAQRYRKQIQGWLKLHPEAVTEIAPQVLVCLFNSPKLQIRKGVDEFGRGHWLLQNVDERLHFNLSDSHERTDAILDHAKTDRWKTPAPDDDAFADCINLLQHLQPGAKRFLIDELITLENKAESEFLQQKQAMDYLYQNGVFGRFNS
ncbi:MAG: hypothetical protein AAF541_00050 [Pseudomonadota bacterium]